MLSIAAAYAIIRIVIHYKPIKSKNEDYIEIEVADNIIDAYKNYELNDIISKKHSRKSHEINYLQSEYSLLDDSYNL